MNGNFQFLKKADKNLYDIITDAERLYKDEYFEQCITQTRRFAEQICKNIMEQNNLSVSTFDEMLSVLEDKSQGSIQEKEFIDDLYFLKKSGNKTVHSGKVKHEAMTALECLKRSFEASLSYCVYILGTSNSILKLNYDVELLITDKKSKKSLKEKYIEAKQNQEQNQNQYNSNPIQKKEKSSYRNNFSYPKNNNKNIPLFWKFILFLCSVSGLMIAYICALLLFKKFLS